MFILWYLYNVYLNKILFLNCVYILSYCKRGSLDLKMIWMAIFCTIIFISKLVSNLLKNFCHITWHQKPTVVLLIDTYIQKLNSQEHTYNWVDICIRQQLASLPDEIPSCSSHFHDSQNCTCRCRLKKMKTHTISIR